MTTNNTTQDFIDKLAMVQTWANAGHFRGIFGESLGAHLWGKFAGSYGHNMLRLWGALDSGNRRTLAAFIDQLSYDSLRENATHTLYNAVGVDRDPRVKA